MKIVDDGYLEVEFPSGEKHTVDVFETYNAMVKILSDSLKDEPAGTKHLHVWADYIEQAFGERLSQRGADLFYDGLAKHVEQLKKKEV